MCFGLFKYRPRQRFQISPAEVHFQTKIRFQKRKLNSVFIRTGQSNFRLLGRFTNARLAYGIELTFDFRLQPFRNRSIHIITTQCRVAVCGKHLKHAFTKLKNRQIKCAAAQIVHRHLIPLRRALKTTRQGRGRGFINNPLHLPTGLFPRQLGGLTLGVIEISRHSNDSTIHRFAQSRLRLSPKFLEDQRRNLHR